MKKVLSFLFLTLFTCVCFASEVSHFAEKNEVDIEKSVLSDVSLSTASMLENAFLVSQPVFSIDEKMLDFHNTQSAYVNIFFEDVLLMDHNIPNVSLSWQYLMDKRDMAFRNQRQQNI